MKPLVTRPIKSDFFDEKTQTLVTWLGMAGAMINVRGTILLIDPLLTMSVRDGRQLCEGEHPLKLPLPIEAKDFPKLDVVLYTHADFDHFGPLTAQVLADRFDTRFIAPSPVVEGLRDLGVAERRITQVREDDAVKLGAASIQVTSALHDWQEQDPWQLGDCCGYLIWTPDGSIWHPGDTRLIPALMEVKDVDLFLFDVAALDAHLGPQGSAKLAESCGAKVMLAYHYGTFDLPPGSYGSCDPDESLVFIEHMQAEFLKPDPGEVLYLPID